MGAFRLPPSLRSRLQAAAAYDQVFIWRCSNVSSMQIRCTAQGVLRAEKGLAIWFSGCFADARCGLGRQAVLLPLGKYKFAFLLSGSHIRKVFEQHSVDV